MTSGWPSADVPSRIRHGQQKKKRPGLYAGHPPDVLEARPPPPGARPAPHATRGRPKRGGLRRRWGAPSAVDCADGRLRRGSSPRGTRGGGAPARPRPHRRHRALRSGQRGLVGALPPPPGPRCTHLKRLDHPTHTPPAVPRCCCLGSRGHAATRAPPWRDTPSKSKAACKNTATRPPPLPPHPQSQNCHHRL